MGQPSSKPSLGEGAYYNNQLRNPLHIDSVEIHTSTFYLVATSACLHALDSTVTDSRLRVLAPRRNACALQIFQSGRGPAGARERGRTLQLFLAISPPVSTLAHKFCSSALEYRNHNTVGRPASILNSNSSRPSLHALRLTLASCDAVGGRMHALVKYRYFACCFYTILGFSGFLPHNLGSPSSDGKRYDYGVVLLFCD